MVSPRLAVEDVVVVKSDLGSTLDEERNVKKWRIWDR